MIMSNSMKYLAPAEGDFEACCTAPAPERWERFVSTREQRGRARLELGVELTAGDLPVASFRGRYVALAGGEE